MLADPLIIAGRTFRSRLIVGTGFSLVRADGFGGAEVALHGRLARPNVGLVLVAEMLDGAQHRRNLGVTEGAQGLAADVVAHAQEQFDVTRPISLSVPRPLRDSRRLSSLTFTRRHSQTIPATQTPTTLKHQSSSKAATRTHLHTALSILYHTQRNTPPPSPPPRH